ncbi:hypothetical protein [Lysobacter sp. TY2-98]|uniref:hypothetical protein n=1 Tax=Lysobacter sp. TY2-98 TaxID=2290922 RepID=UPI0013B45235|nr:hypothetical protein [Lysobacter sp. TY2-98]
MSNQPSTPQTPQNRPASPPGDAKAASSARVPPRDAVTSPLNVPVVGPPKRSE